MTIQILEENASILPDYGKISPAFTVKERFVVEPVRNGLGGLALELEHVEPPYVKDYDWADGEGPAGWLRRWDLSQWGVFSGFEGSKRVGGAVIAWNTPGVQMLELGQGLPALWDIRVDPGHRKQGIGSALFRAAVDWARQKGCAGMTIETQNINVPACRFYARQGARLAAIDPFAYRDFPDEIQFIWLIKL